ncbi:MAG: exodeoxyribonuclease VII large subunit [Alphaproteobacteria bacterium]
MEESELLNQPGANVGVYTVGELSHALKRTLEEGFGHVRVRGEISGFKRHASGHLYFALKDSDAVLDAVCWRGSVGRLGLAPEDGMEVIASGRITTYPGRSKYQIVVERLELAGVGALLKLLEERKKKLEAEGLFDAARKRALPYLPELIGVVTSPTGAVIRDILHRIAERFPRRVLVWPVLVQGEGAAEQVAAAIRGFNALPEAGPAPRPDLLIVARGGGSLEDLWAFNEEIVVRAAAESRIPLISAVGHETDTTLIDFAADRRAPTPSAAAEMAVPVRADLQRDVLGYEGRALGAFDRLLRHRRERTASLARGLNQVPGMVQHAMQRLDDRGDRFETAMHTRLQRLGARLEAARVPHPRHVLAVKRERADAAARRLARVHPSLGLGARNDQLAQLADRLLRARRLTMDHHRQRLDTASRLLESHSYKEVLKRGYVVVRDEKGRPVRSASTVSPGDALGLEFTDGTVNATATGGGAPDTSQPHKPRRPKKDDSRQGELL